MLDGLRDDAVQGIRTTRWGSAVETGSDGLDIQPFMNRRARGTGKEVVIYSGCGIETGTGALFTEELLRAVGNQRFPTSVEPWFSHVAGRVREATGNLQQPIGVDAEE